MTTKSADSFAAFASFKSIFCTYSNSKPTLKQAEEAIICLCQIYGAANEEVLLERGDAELIEIYKEIKLKILKEVI